MLDLREEFKSFTARHLPKELPYFEALWSVTQEWLTEWEGVLPEHWPSAEKQAGEWLADLGFADLGGVDAVLPALMRATEATFRDFHKSQSERMADAATIERLAAIYAHRFGVPSVLGRNISSFVAGVVKATEHLRVTSGYEIVCKREHSAPLEHLALENLRDLTMHRLSPDGFDLWINLPELDFCYRKKSVRGFSVKRERLTPISMTILAHLLARQNDVCDYLSLSSEVWHADGTVLGLGWKSETRKDPRNYIHRGLSRLLKSIDERKIAILRSRIKNVRQDGYMLANGVSFCTIQLRRRQTSYKPAQ